MEILLVSIGQRSGGVGTDRLLVVWTFTGVKKMKMISRFFKDESGATAIEYGLIAALIAVVIIGAVTALGTELSGNFAAITAAI
nr:Flp family type IVb pilin [Maricaulis salignorans]|tara:strand:- start:5467 stop:5718 length:252 start_codon:yes stop_codon:yes gene_type:complete